MPAKPFNAFNHSAADDWTLERISRMSAKEIAQLRENAERLNERGVSALCEQALASVRTRARPGRKRASA
jgi:hypothetical protein